MLQVTLILEKIFNNFLFNLVLKNDCYLRAILSKILFNNPPALTR